MVLCALVPCALSTGIYAEDNSQDFESLLRASVTPTKSVSNSVPPTTPTGFVPKSTEAESVQPLALGKPRPNSMRTVPLAVKPEQKANSSGWVAVVPNESSPGKKGAGPGGEPIALKAEASPRAVAQPTPASTTTDSDADGAVEKRNTPQSTTSSWSRPEAVSASPVSPFGGLRENPAGKTATTRTFEFLPVEPESYAVAPTHDRGHDRGLLKTANENILAAEGSESSLNEEETDDPQTPEAPASGEDENTSEEEKSSKAGLLNDDAETSVEAAPRDEQENAAEENVAEKPRESAENTKFEDGVDTKATVPPEESESEAKESETPAQLKPEVFEVIASPENTKEAKEAEDAETGETANSGAEDDSTVVMDKPVVDEPVIGGGGTVDMKKVGDPHAATKIKLLRDEIMNGLKSRNMTGRMGMWQNYAKSTLRSTNSVNTNSEIDARCRLGWYVKLYSDVLGSVVEIDEFSRSLHHALIGDHTRFAQALKMIREKLDVSARNDDGVQFAGILTPQCAVDAVVKATTDAQVGMSRALSTLTTAEQNELATNLYQTFSGSGCVNGHTIPNRSFGRRLCSLMEKMDKTGVHQAGDAFAPLTSRKLLDLLAQLPEDAYEHVMISGQKFQRVVAPTGDILIGGRENNTYDLDSADFKDVVCVIDLGGNDTYREGTCNINRPVLVLIDVGPGNDVYTASKPGVQGGSILGASLLINVEGNTTYTAVDVAQGSTIGGIGMLIDYAGNDGYKALRRAQGHALCGVGILLDRG
ncbi:MAG TPA: hypothetical protein DEB39_15300, partial [Planctomycetaceae bacterium]|nr:hypothetical protein [Planctomycetaceae bacterium]